nr:helix-turn-helix domain-containing protein [Scytonema sp. UIC 10036]
MRQPEHSLPIGYFLPVIYTIADALEERDWTQAQLAERLGYTTKHISLLINGKALQKFLQMIN